MNCNKYPGYFKSSISQRCCKNCDEYTQTFTHPVVGTFSSTFTNTGETCFRPDWSRTDIFTCRPDEIISGPRCYPKSTGKVGKAGSLLSCNEETTEDYDAGLCYPKCRPGFHGVGPVCWQDCAGLVNTDCAAACATNTTVCLNQVRDQILGPIILAANIAMAVLTAGGSAAATAAGKVVGAGAQVSVKMADGSFKIITASTRIGGLALKAVNMFQNIKTTVKVADAVTKYTKIQKGFKKVKETLQPLFKVFKKVRKISKEYNDELESYRRAYSNDFATQTSKEIEAAVDYRYGAGTSLASFIKTSWSEISLQEMSVAMGAASIENILSAAAAVDPTGFLDVVNAYNKPKCVPIDQMPCSSLAKNC